MAYVAGGNIEKWAIKAAALIRREGSATAAWRSLERLHMALWFHVFPHASLSLDAAERVGGHLGRTMGMCGGPLRGLSLPVAADELLLVLRAAPLCSNLDVDATSCGFGDWTRGLAQLRSSG